MGFLSALLGVAKTVAPYAISFVKNGATGIAKDIADGNLAMGVSSVTRNGMAGRSILTDRAIRMMGPEDPSTVQQIDIAINSALDAEQTIDWYQDTVRQRMQILAPYLANASVTEVQTLNASIQLVFGKESKVVIDGDKSYSVVGPNDHGYFHCIPNRFDGWEKMKNYEMFSVVAMLCTDEQGNEFGTSSITKFLPVSINTENISNERLSNIDSGVTADKNSISQFLTVLMSGNQYKFDYVDYNYKNLRPCFANVNSNPIFFTDYVDDLYKDKKECISFGTFIFMRPNFSNTEITVRYNIKMFVVGISQSSSYNLSASQNPAPEPEPTPDPDDKPDDKPDDGDDKPDDGNDGDDGSDGTSPAPTSNKPTKSRRTRIRGH